MKVTVKLTSTSEVGRNVKVKGSWSLEQRQSRGSWTPRQGYSDNQSSANTGEAARSHRRRPVRESSSVTQGRSPNLSHTSSYNLPISYNTFVLELSWLIMIVREQTKSMTTTW